METLDSENRMLNRMEALLASRLNAFEEKINDSQRQISDTQLNKIQQNFVANDKFQFKRKGNEEQFKVNVKVLSSMGDAESHLNGGSSEKVEAARQSILQGNTALHDSAESGSLEILKLLLEHNAKMEKDAYGMTPLLAAAVAGYSNIVEIFIERSECTQEERIDALELLGATYVDKKCDMLGAIAFWRQAMEERYQDEDHPLVKPKEAAPNPAYKNSKEVVTIEQLDDLIADPDDVRMQALLIRERILGPAHPDTSYYIRYRGALYAELGNFDRCILLWMYALDMQQDVLEPLSPMTLSSFLSFAELFLFMTTEWRNLPAHAVSFRNIMDVLLKSIYELERGRAHLKKMDATERDMTNSNPLLVIIMHFLCVMCRLKKNQTEAEEKEFKVCVYRLIRLNPVGAKGFTPLHLSCSRETTYVGQYPVCSFPALPVIELLVDVGGDVNALDSERNTPLHIAASNRPCPSEVFNFLLKNGAHIDACNADRKTPVQLIRGMSIYEIVSPLEYSTLQCLAAKQIIRSAIPYKRLVSKHVEKFIEMH